MKRAHITHLKEAMYIDLPNGLCVYIDWSLDELIIDSYDPDRDELFDEAMDKFCGYAEQFAEYGAGDSEPRRMFAEVAEHALAGHQVNWDQVNWSLFFMEGSDEVHDKLTAYAKKILSKN